SPTQVGLTWTASTDNVAVTGYNVLRNGAKIGTTSAASATSYTDSAVVANTTYSYTVTAFDAAGNTSGPSNAASVTTPVPPDTVPPTAPTNLTAAAASATQVNLSW